MRRGFKTEANAIAREVRKELGLATASPLDVWQLAEHLEITGISLSSLSEAAPLAAALFLNEGRGIFSGVTVFRGNERTIVFNDAHVPGRQVSDIGHELSHGLLLHPPGAAMDERGCRYWDRDVEDEANWLSGVDLPARRYYVQASVSSWSIMTGEAAVQVRGRSRKARIWRWFKSKSKRFWNLIWRIVVGEAA